MEVIVHDFSGHPFQAELSRKLAGRGHTVEHVSAEQYVSGKGHLEHQDDDPDSLTFSSIKLDLPFKKYAPFSRLRWERAYAHEWIAQLRSWSPDVVIACNLPLITLFLFSRHAKRRKLAWVLWHQDIYSFALADELRRKLPRPLAWLGGKVLVGLEARCARRAAHVVAIGDAFEGVYRDWNVPTDHVSVIPNWAPLDKIYPVERDNARTADLFDAGTELRLVYAGTLGRKHNPRLLIDLLTTVRSKGIDAEIAVISEGEAADDLATIARDEKLPVRVLPFQPAADLPNVLGTADVLVALLEPDATKFSIPSKVLSYMAAGRPILGLMPADNPAAADIVATGGHVGLPSTAGALASVEWLVTLEADPELVATIGKRSREVAEQKFDVDKVAAEFETILTDVTAARSSSTV
ncbi:glycosyltransferase family 4 protein [Aeromicrobium ginsengisoli]|uniref:Glycosyltransferase family 4 protein n=1 Tax=Aeromicrobium ginsengisoli TaxID=363867 RepID=A0A5M4FCJ5_9ACTN|nr:glycosyltransferase family 4 protein [Aeromicrobium ginsengisoli]KAA1396076.1 glycosyltransferase family 4 protein [Aeromicrobium ginsengisoli]